MNVCSAQWLPLKDTQERFDILAFIEARLKEGLINEVNVSEELKRAELMVVAQAYLQAEITVRARAGLAFPAYFGRDFSYRQVEQTLHFLSFCG